MTGLFKSIYLSEQASVAHLMAAVPEILKLECVCLLLADHAPILTLPTGEIDFGLCGRPTHRTSTEAEGVILC